MTRREETAIIIRSIVKANPKATTPELRKLANKAYPWGVRQHHPIIAWRKAMNDVFGASPQKLSGAKRKQVREDERLGRVSLFGKDEL